MKKWFAELSANHKTVIISFVVVIIVYIGLIFGYFIKLPGVPNGFLLGGITGVLSYLLLLSVDKKDKEKGKLVWTIVITILRYVFIGGLIALSIVLEYRFDIKIFNVFAVLGGYFVSLITYIVILLIERKNV